MAKRENFTAERVATFKFTPSEKGKSNQTVYWDGKTPGLGLRVTNTGSKSYVFETSLHRKTLRITIGDTRTWSIGKAQAKATELKTLTDQGIDPRQLEADRLAAIEAKQAADEAEQQADQLEAQRQTVTMREAWAEYIEAKRHAKKDGKPVWCAQYLIDHEYVIAGKNTPAPLASLVDLRLIDLTPERIAKWLKDESAKRPTSSSVAFRKLRAFVAWCASHKTYAELIPANSCAAESVRNEVRKGKPKTDNLQREQLPLWFAEVGKLPLVVAAYLRTLLLTGARREELAGLRWTDVDFKWNSLTIKDKVEDQRIIPLTPYVSQMLAELKRNNDTPKVRKLKGQDEQPKWKPSPWVFFSPTAKSGRIAGPHVAHQKALTTAALPHISIHGLRRSFKSLAEWVEMPVGVVAQIMGHKQSATAEKHYTVRPLDLLRVWHSRYESWILEQAGIEFKQPDKERQSGLREVA
jgi:integrase